MARSPESLHARALAAFRHGNRGRLFLCEVLCELGDSRAFLSLGYPSLSAYAEEFFQLRRAELFEHVRVGRAMRELPAMRESFRAGRLGWSVLKAATRVAVPGSEERWIELASEAGVERTVAEARRARREGRNAPQEDPFALPNLDEKLVIRLPRADMAKLRVWLEQASRAVAEKTGNDDVPLEQALLYLCERDAGGAGRAGAAGAGPGCGSPRARLIYQRCPDCRRNRLATEDGFVEVDDAEVERYAGSAEVARPEEDGGVEPGNGPTPAALRRRVLDRDGERCRNPRCRQPADHGHHIEFRSKGGATVSTNIVAVCRTCHSLIHAGALCVLGDADTQSLRWVPRMLRPGSTESAIADLAMRAPRPLPPPGLPPRLRRPRPARRVERPGRESSPPETEDSGS